MFAFQVSHSPSVRVVDQAWSQGWASSHQFMQLACRRSSFRLLANYARLSAARQQFFGSSSSSCSAVKMLNRHISGRCASPGGLKQPQSVKLNNCASLCSRNAWLSMPHHQTRRSFALIPAAAAAIPGGSDCNRSMRFCRHLVCQTGIDVRPLQAWCQAWCHAARLVNNWIYACSTAVCSDIAQLC